MFEPAPEADEDVEPDVVVEVEVGFKLALFMEVDPPQPAKVAAVRITKQIFTTKFSSFDFEAGIPNRRMRGQSTTYF